MKHVLLLFSIILTIPLTAQNGPWYVNPSASTNGTGTQASPFNKIPEAVEHAFLNGGGEVLVTDGVHELTNSQKITTAATASDSVIIKPVTPYGVKFEFAVRSAFDFQVGSSYVTLQGFEIDGKTYLNDFWCTVAEDLWSDFGNPEGGGLAIIADGEHINIYDNYVHDCYQKGVEIADGRYVNLHGNIIRNIAQYSLSGGHGIMRQQAGDLEYNDPDDPDTYRWDIHGNLIFNVEQRIYSWVPRKGFMEMVIDEGKSILIDDPKNTDGTMDQMTARIKNNVVAFGAVDHIRLKSTPGLEVSNNSIFSQVPNGDGITDKGADDNPNGPNTLFSNFTAHGNAVQTEPNIFAIEIDHCLGESYGTGNDPMGNTPAGAVTNNYVAVGRYKPRNEANVDITEVNTTELFVNPTQGDFTINPSLNLPAGVGVDPAILADLNAKASAFGATIAWDGWITDNLKLSQTILDNIPGVNDGIVDNELVFTDAGVINNTYEHIDFNVVDGSWKAARNSPDHQEFGLNPEYTAWYTQVATNHLNAAGEVYERIRWGCSEVKQDQVFDPDWLTVSQITDRNNPTLINGYDNTFTLDGDLLIDFEDYTPSPGDEFDLMQAGNITSANTGDLFDRVLFEGYTPGNYSLEIVNSGGGQVLRLTILEVLPVSLFRFAATKLAKSVDLTWSTATETNNDYFEVERSTNGRSWEAIGRVAGQGNSGVLTNYSFTDQTPLIGENYYRLRQTDFDGQFSLSNVELVNFTSGTQVVYPNPACQWFVVKTSFPAGQVTLRDAGGRDVTNLCPVRATEDGLRFNARQLTPGVYYLDLGKAVEKVIIR